MMTNTKHKTRLWLFIAGIILLTAGIATLVLTLTPAKEVFVEWSEKPGNTMSNLSYSGFAAESNGWIYIIDAQTDYQGLYRTKTDGSQCDKLYKYSCSYINVCDDWLYFRSWDGKLCKMHTDGSNLTILYDKTGAIYIWEDWIIFSSRDMGYSRMRTDGSQTTAYPTYVSRIYGVTDGWIYYNNFKDNSLYKVRVDGSDETLVAINLFCLQMDDNWIYYSMKINKGYLEFCPLSKLNMKSGKEVQLSDGKADKIFIDGNWIYYNAEDGIYRINKDGTGEAKISDDTFLAMNATKDWLIYRSSKGVEGLNGIDSYHLMKMRRDGSEASTFWGDTTADGD